MERSKIHQYQKNNNNALVKPQKEPFTNSFVILIQDEQDAETVYWLAYSLWKARFWHQSLVGSVIPFLRIDDFKNDFNSKVNEMLQEDELHKKQVQALRLLEQKEGQFHENIKLINDLRRIILNHYCK
jgi:Rad3-related DNA helicase